MTSLTLSTISQKKLITIARNCNSLNQTSYKWHRPWFFKNCREAILLQHAALQNFHARSTTSNLIFFKFNGPNAHSHSYSRMTTSIESQQNKQMGFKFSMSKTQCVHFISQGKMHRDPVIKLEESKILVIDQY